MKSSNKTEITHVADTEGNEEMVANKAAMKIAASFMESTRRVAM